MKSSSARLLLTFITAAVSIQLAGCAPTPVKLHAAESLQYGNPMKRIAIIGAGRVFLPGMSSDKQSFISMEGSKKAVENQAVGMKNALRQMGYKVVYAKPVGVGYNNWSVDQERWVYAAGKKHQIVGSAPAFEYPATAANSKYRNAVRQEFSKINAMLPKDSMDKYAPEKSNLKIIQQATGGDTICFMTVSGNKHSEAEKAASTAENVGGFIFGLVSPITVTSNLPDDSTATSLVCSQAATGKVMWQATGSLDIDPLTKPPVSYYQGFLSTFPKAGAKMTGKCTFVDKAASLYDCTDDSN